LGAARFHSGDEREEAVRRGAGHDLADARRLQFTKTADEVLLIDFVPEFGGAAQMLAIHARGGGKLARVESRAGDLFFGERGEVFEMACVASLQQRIGEHLAERGREVQGETRASARRLQRREHVEQRQVDFGDGFVEPVFF
jgi:hypothetical protein